ncbi:subclass B3 metallo-beta-lactamase [Dyella soli]
MVFACLGAVAVAAAHAEPAAWSQPQKPFRIHGNTYYVGTRGLSAILIASPQGLVLIDGPLARNTAQIEASIKALGFRLTDIRVILNTHAHGDHAGAVAALARDSGARVQASVAGAKALMLGGNDPDDPQFGDAPTFAPVASVMTVPDGGSVRVGDTVLTAHYTPGHTPGSTTWTWQSCEAGRCLSMVYADSLSAVSADGYRFTDDAAHPRRVEEFRHSIDAIAALPCDLLITPHPDQSAFLEKVARRDAGVAPDPVVDAGACRAYAAAGRAALEARLARERAAAPGPGQAGH